MTRIQRCENPRLNGVEVDALDSLRASKQLSFHVEPHICGCPLNAASQGRMIGLGEGTMKGLGHAVQVIS
jgi:hypothetical protein